MKLIISDEILNTYPDLSIGVIVANNINNDRNCNEIKKMLEEVQEKVKTKFNIDNISENFIIKKWRKIYSEFGSKPSDYKCSVEALIRSILKGRNLRYINKVVDLYNVISLKHIIPAGGEDLDYVKGNIYLKHAEGAEIFVPLNSELEENPYKGEIIYCDDRNNVLCRRWNWRESNVTKITEKTKNVVLVLEGFDKNVEEALLELSGLMKTFCKCHTKTYIIDKNTNKVEW